MLTDVGDGMQKVVYAVKVRHLLEPDSLRLRLDHIMVKESQR